MLAHRVSFLLEKEPSPCLIMLWSAELNENGGKRRCYVSRFERAAQKLWGKCVPVFYFILFCFRSFSLFFSVVFFSSLQEMPKPVRWTSNRDNRSDELIHFLSGVSLSLFFLLLLILFFIYFKLCYAWCYVDAQCIRVDNWSISSDCVAVASR